VHVGGDSLLERAFEAITAGMELSTHV
ncbi:MAG: hypothetical protein K0R62_5928, partial [Nonomuraea muscovyensis]|nr:hypothetical protein [Nonomuraea muscovyensis]